jgi:NADH:ubiquinone reductase (non-electrogenic)
LLPFPYDIPSVPLQNNKGVREHCQFLKQIEDAASLRKAIAYCFERANIPSLSKKEISDALSFVIVGAGPTGVSLKQNAV